MRRVAFVMVVMAGLTFGGFPILSASAANLTPPAASPFVSVEPPSGPGMLAMAAVASVPRTGLLVGRLGVGGGPARRGRSVRRAPPGPTVLITGRHFSRKLVTESTGTFRVRLRPGRYTVRGLVGGFCPSVNVPVEAGRQTRIKLLCSVR